MNSICYEKMIETLNFIHLNQSVMPVFIIVILSFFVILFFISTNKIKVAHDDKIKQFEAIINSLFEKQKLLNEKVLIADDYKTNYTKDMKLLCDEVVALQKVFINLIAK